MDLSTISKVLTTLKLAEGLKKELRHSWLSDGRRESVAEHTYQMCLMAVFTARYLEHPVDIERTLKIILYHDLVEAIAGDIPFFEESDRKKEKVARENEAIKVIRDSLPGEVGKEVFELWHEFEEAKSVEAKFARAIDHLEVQLQHNLAPLETWEPIEYDLVHTKMDPNCAHDSFLKELCDAVKGEAVDKMGSKITLHTFRGNGLQLGVDLDDCASLLDLNDTMKSTP